MIFLIKVSKYIYIHFLTICLFAVCYITRTLEEFAAVYAVMFLHETAHTAAAIKLGLGISRIELYPFGVTLKIKSRVLCSVSDEFILYLSGPAVNACAALVCIFFEIRGVFFYNNILLFVINLLPVMPLDGGQLCYGLLWQYFGEKRASAISKTASAAVGILLCAVIWKYAGISINSTAFCLFVAAGIFTQKPKYSRDIVRTLTARKTVRKVNKCNVISVRNNANNTDIIKSFVPHTDNLIISYGSNGEIENIETDEGFIRKILS